MPVIQSGVENNVLQPCIFRANIRRENASPGVGEGHNVSATLCRRQLWPPRKKHYEFASLQRCSEPGMVIRGVSVGDASSVFLARGTIETWVFISRNEKEKFWNGRTVDWKTGVWQTNEVVAINLVLL